tara:strand:+ start:399 stop:626 length:228 start_codon:yes stop_codon:yes gene_type:complete
MKEVIGYILIIIGVGDFLLGNFGNINLTYFLGPLSSFTPFVFGGLGVLILNYDPNNNDDPALDRFKEKKAKTRKK